MPKGKKTIKKKKAKRSRPRGEPFAKGTITVHRPGLGPNAPGHNARSDTIEALENAKANVSRRRGRTKNPRTKNPGKVEPRAQGTITRNRPGRKPKRKR